MCPLSGVGNHHIRYRKNVTESRYVADMASQVQQCTGEKVEIDWQRTMGCISPWDFCFSGRTVGTCSQNTSLKGAH